MAVLLLLYFVPAASADIAVLMLEATGTGAARYTSGGHSAVFLSGVCQETPVRVRLCKPGESGSVVSNYMDFGEEGSPEWNAVPANIFFYGVDDPQNAPLYADGEIRALLQEEYRQKYLAELCPTDVPCGSGEGHWSDMVGATFSRDIYAFRISTTKEQDQQIVDDLNSLPNVNRYSGFTRNCADFTRLLVNKYFPGSARADWLNDFGMTSPKAVARSFAQYGKRHPELHYSVEKYTQLAGPIRRSLDNRNGTEVGFRAKKWSFPLLLLRSHMLMYFAASYYLTAWFNPEREYRNHHLPSPGMPVADWTWYKQQFPDIVSEAIQAGVFSGKREMERYFRVLESEVTTQITPEGIPAISLGPARVVLTHASLTRGDAASRLLAERLLLARISATLKAREKNRPTLSEMERDWQALEQLRRWRKAEPAVTISGH